MEKQKEKAIILRKQGFSYSEIGKQIGTSKSTLSLWLKNVKLSKKSLDRINSRTHKKSIEALIRRNQEQTVLARHRAEKIMFKARKEFKVLKKQPLFLIGVSLYWAEGYKKGAYGSSWKSVDFANSDPAMVILIIKFFEKYLCITKQRLAIQIIAHDNVNLKQSVDYWSKITGVSKSNFIKTCCSKNINSKGKRNKKNLPHGTVHIRINDVKLFFKVIGWIEGLKEFYKI